MPTVYDGLFPNGTFLTAPTKRAQASTVEPTEAAPLTPEACALICSHMNDDHADAIAAYARVYGKRDEVTSARMRSMTALSMNLDVHTSRGEETCTVLFDHTLTSADDARDTLIAMAMAQS